MNRTEFAQGLALLTGAVGKSMPDEQIAAWFAMMKDLTAEQFKTGIVETLRTHHYAGFPPIGTVRSNALAGAAGAIQAEDRPLLAWNAVQQALDELRARHNVNFDDRVINATIRSLGGWPRVAYTPSSELQWYRKEFRELYSALCRVELSDEQTGHLLGDSAGRRPEKDRDGNTVNLLEVVDVACLTGPRTAGEALTTRLEVLSVEPPRIETPYKRSPEEEKEYLERMRDWYAKGIESDEKSAEQKAELAKQIEQADERIAELDKQIADNRERYFDRIDQLKESADAARQALVAKMGVDDDDD